MGWKWREEGREETGEECQMEKLKIQETWPNTPLIYIAFSKYMVQLKKRCLDRPIPASIHLQSSQELNIISTTIFLFDQRTDDKT